MASRGGGNTFTEFGGVADALVSDTRRALAAAKRIPLRAARKGYEFLREFSEQHVYSGGFRASVSIGVDSLPPLDSAVANVTDAERHRRARTGNVFAPPDIGELLDVEARFELGDTIVLGSDLWYADEVDAKFDAILSRQLEQIVEVELERGIQEFNRRSDAAVRGTGGEVFE